MGVYRPKKSKYWWIDFYCKGKRYRESSESTRKKDAEQLLAKRKYEVSQGIQKPSPEEEDNSDPVFSEFIPQYMEWAKDYKKPLTIERNYQFLKHLDPYVSDKRLSKITLVVAEEYKNGRKKQGASNATINRERSFLKAVLNKSVKWGLLEKNPLQYMEPLPESHLFNRYLTYEETMALIDACEDHLKPIIITSIHTGFRWGSVLNMKWQEVDLVNSLIIFKDPVKKGDTVYPLPDEVRKALKNVPKNGSPYIFVNPETGKPWKNLRIAFRRAKTKAGITKPFRLHDLRHSFASNLVMSGNDLKTVQELLGHRNISTTLRYAHLSLEHKKKAVDGLFKQKDENDGNDHE